MKALRATRPAVIVSDIGMPRMDGLSSCAPGVPRKPAASASPAMALTAFARSEFRKRVLLAGFQAHLAKPFDVGELILLVADLVGRR